MRFIFLLLSISAFNHSLFAQKQNADSIFALPPIEVTALRVPVANMLAPVRISVISSETVKATASNNLAELLNRAGSPFIRQYGTGLATLSFRGTSSAQTLILLDGIPLSDPQLGQIDLSLLPTAIIEEVHLLHGQGSSLYGSQSMGGVINLKTKQNHAPFFLNTTVAAGPYKERNGHLVTGLAKGSISGLISISHGFERGDFPYLNASLFPPQTTRRVGADRRHTSAFIKVSLNQHRASTTLSGWFNDTERGLPGAAATTSKNERQWDQNSRLQAVHLTPASFGLLSFSGAWQNNSLRYLNPQINIDQTSHTSVTTLEVELSQLALPFPVATGISGNLYGATHPALRAKARETQFSWFGNAALSNKRAGVFPALRIDTFFPVSGKRLVALSPSLGFNVQPLDTFPLRMKLSAGGAFRAPTFNDRFWQPGGNPELKPEHGWNYEAGAVYAQANQSANIVVEILGFSHHIKDQIIWLPADLPGTQDFWAPQNIGITRTTGAEATASTSFNLFSRTRFTTQLNYTLADSRDVSDINGPAYNQPLRYTPRHVFKSQIGLARKKGQMRWNVDFTAQHISRRYVTTDGSQYLAPYNTASVNLRMTRMTKHAAYTAGVFFENISNEAYEVIKGYPVPPRLLRIQLLIQLPGEG